MGGWVDVDEKWFVLELDTKSDGDGDGSKDGYIRIFALMGRLKNVVGCTLFVLGLFAFLEVPGLVCLSQKALLPQREMEREGEYERCSNIILVLVLASFDLSSRWDLFSLVPCVMISQIFRLECIESSDTFKI